MILDRNQATQIIHENLKWRFGKTQSQYHWLKAKTGKTSLSDMKYPELIHVLKIMEDSGKFIKKHL